MITKPASVHAAEPIQVSKKNYFIITLLDPQAEALPS
jgi:hypothetical protein